MKNIGEFLKNNWAIIAIIILCAFAMKGAYNCGRSGRDHEIHLQKQKLHNEMRKKEEAIIEKSKEEIEELKKKYDKAISDKNENVASLRSEIEKIEITSTVELKRTGAEKLELIVQIEKRDEKIGILENIVVELELTIKSQKVTHDLIVKKYERILEGKDKIIQSLNELYEDTRRLSYKRRVRISPFLGWAPIELGENWRAGIAITY